jgi:hypothetical protein
MIDPTLLTAITDLWTAEKVRAEYEVVFNACYNRLLKQVVLTSKNTDSDSAGAQIVIKSEDYTIWLATMSARLRQIQAEEAGADTIFTGTEHVTHHNRYVST